LKTKRHIEKWSLLATNKAVPVIKAIKFMTWLTGGKARLWYGVPKASK